MGMRRLIKHLSPESTLPEDWAWMTCNGTPCNVLSKPWTLRENTSHSHSRLGPKKTRLVSLPHRIAHPRPRSNCLPASEDV